MRPIKVSHYKIKKILSRNDCLDGDLNFDSYFRIKTKIVGMPIHKYTYIRNIEKIVRYTLLVHQFVVKNRIVRCTTFLNVHFNEGLKVASWGTINSVYTTFPSVAYLHATTLDNNNVVTLIEFNKLWGCDGATFISF